MNLKMLPNLAVKPIYYLTHFFNIFKGVNIREMTVSILF